MKKQLCLHRAHDTLFTWHVKVLFAVIYLSMHFSQYYCHFIFLWDVLLQLTQQHSYMLHMLAKHTSTQNYRSNSLTTNRSERPRTSL